MTERPSNSEENPLDDWATELSEMLDSAPINLNEKTTDSVQGGQVHMQQSSARTIDAHALRMEESAVGFVKAQSVDVDDSIVGMAVASEMSLQNVNSSILAAGDVDATEIRTVALFAQHVNGDVKTVVTPLTAILIGAGFGLAMFVLKRIAGRFSATAQEPLS